MEPVLTIGIAGASGSGKSTLSAALIKAFNSALPGSAVSLPVDAYYRDLSHMTFAERDGQNFDHPDALDLDLTASHLEALRRGQAVNAPVYDFSSHMRLPNTQHIPASTIVVVEGILAMASARLANLYDISVFVETPLDTCLSRRIARDTTERGRTEASVRLFWSERVLPMYRQYGEAARKNANLHVDGTAPVEQAIRVIQSHLEVLRRRH